MTGKSFNKSIQLKNSFSNTIRNLHNYYDNVRVYARKVITNKAKLREKQLDLLSFYCTTLVS